jgi:hypothetical protein
MGTRLRTALLTAVAAIAIAFAVPPFGGTGTTLADGPCSNGTNWDNIRQVCW